MVGSALAIAAAPGFRVAQEVRVGADRLQVLEDARLDAPLVAQMWRDGCPDPAMELDKADPRAAKFTRDDIRPVRLRLIDARGRSLASVRPDPQAPIARIDPRPLGHGPGAAILVTTNDSACMGSYSGELVSFYQIDHGALRALAAVDAHGRSRSMTVFSSLKSGWRFVPGSHRTAIQQWFCRPDFRPEGQKETFTMTYVTYAFDGRTWRVAKRKRPGFFEGEGPWPTKDFPGPPRR
ncbi:MAG TPA: hypothetical protein VG248_14155 [Caulobacteraceae bacterium]|jgi:hypothetical protein|nr:hypothetical protein [Caulobacteraceae bacterium]